MDNLFLLAGSLILVIKSADFAITHASKITRSLRLPKYIFGFLVVGIISILPETFIAITSSLRGIPEFGLGTLFGSNVADLTLVLAVVVFASAQGLRAGSKILESNKWYPLLLALPILVGFDGDYTRSEGALLVVSGLFFYYWVFKKNRHNSPPTENHQGHRARNVFYLFLGMAGLLLGANFTVKYGVAFAESVGVSPLLIGMFVVALGTTLPELVFSVRAAKQNRDDLALGDVLGTVVSDATVVVGIIALLNPFSFPRAIIYVTAAFMVAASVVLFGLMRSGKILTKREALYLLLFYLAFVAVEYAVNR